MTISSRHASNSIPTKWVAESPNKPLRMRNSFNSCEKRANESGDSISAYKSRFKIFII